MTLTPEEGYLILSVLAAWFAAIVAYMSLVLDRRDRKAQLDLMNETIETFTKAVKSYEKSIKKARKTKVARGPHVGLRPDVLLGVFRIGRVYL